MTGRGVVLGLAAALAVFVVATMWLYVEKGELEARVALLEDENRELMATKSMLEDMVARLNETIERLRSENEGLRDEVRSLSNRVSELLREKEVLERERAGLERRVEELTNENRELRDRIENLTRVVERLRDENERLRSRLVQINETLSKPSKYLDKLFEALESTRITSVKPDKIIYEYYYGVNVLAPGDYWWDWYVLSEGDVVRVELTCPEAPTGATCETDLAIIFYDPDRDSVLDYARGPVAEFEAPYDCTCEVYVWYDSDEGPRVGVSISVTVETSVPRISDVFDYVKSSGIEVTEPVKQLVEKLYDVFLYAEYWKQNREKLARRVQTDLEGHEAYAVSLASILYDAGYTVGLAAVGTHRPETVEDLVEPISAVPVVRIRVGGELSHSTVQMVVESMLDLVPVPLRVWFLDKELGATYVILVFDTVSVYLADEGLVAKGTIAPYNIILVKYIE